MSIQIENAALRHHLKVYKRKDRKPEIKAADRMFWSLISQIWSGWKDALYFVKPATVVSWRRKKFRDHWTGLCRNGKSGRPSVDRKIICLIRDMSKANPLWGSPRIRDELMKVGIDLAKSTIEKYMVKHRKPPSPTWRAFWDNHVKGLVSIDFFVVPTIRNTVLFVLLVLAQDRRRVVHFNNETPNSGMDCSAVSRSFPIRYSPSISSSRSRQHIRPSLSESSEKHGHTRSEDRTGKSMAKPLC
ncbi:MAG: hypothetical protein ACMUJM_25550 [bacterium]